MSYTNVMLDLETLGNRSNSAIISIGAIACDAQTLAKDGYYVVVDLQSSLDAGLEIDASTIKWWFSQPAKAQAIFNDKTAADLETALQGFRNYVFKMSDGNPQTVKVWGNSCAFDNVIIGNAYDKLGIKRPWKFWNDRCYRTLKQCYKNVPFVEPKLKHHALEDAVAQAKHLQAINQKAGGIYL